jgi:hypothetical protein
LPTAITRADFYTDQYRISADVNSGHGRLLEALRDPTRQYLDLRRVRVTPCDGSHAAAEYGDAVLNKAAVEWIAVRSEPPRGAGRLYGYVRKTPVRAALVLRTCRIEGTIHVQSGTTDPVAFFLRGSGGLEKVTDRFLAVTDATITPTPEDTSGALNLVIVNRASVLLYTALR